VKSLAVKKTWMGSFVLGFFFVLVVVVGFPCNSTSELQH
jgi:hypothetical protein